MAEVFFRERFDLAERGSKEVAKEQRLIGDVDDGCRSGRGRAG